MADSVALLRRKVEDASLAVQDATMNSVITLATIEVSHPLSHSPLYQTNASVSVREGQHRGRRDACGRSQEDGRDERGNPGSEGHKPTDRKDGQLVSHSGRHIMTCPC
jgi:hypothetical protein